MFAFLSILLLISTASALEPPTLSIAEQEVLAFPGAVGFGKHTKGGRGGKVMYVRNLGDTGEGSLRACIQSTGPRICIFSTGGTIRLGSELHITTPFITIAGQTAPGDGIQLRGGGIVVSTDHVLIRHIRVRPGVPRSVRQVDACAIRTGRHIYVDHVTCQWGNDGSFDVRKAGGPVPEDVTIAHSIITEPFAGSALPMILDGKNITLYRSLISHGVYRFPNSGMCKGEGCQHNGIHQIINTLAFDWKAGLYFANDSVTNPILRADILSNLYIKSIPPQGTNMYPFLASTNLGPVHVFSAQNISPARPTLAESENQNYGPRPKNLTIVDQPHMSDHGIPLHDVMTLEAFLLPQVGATKPRRDAQDQRLVDAVTNRTRRFCYYPPDYWCGGWPNLQSGPVAPDTDGDGLPDRWEDIQLLDKHDPNDGAAVSANGYTHLENWLNALAGDDVP